MVEKTRIGKLLGAKLRIPPPPTPECQITAPGQTGRGAEAMRCLTTTRLTEERSRTDPITGVTTTWTELIREEGSTCPGVAAGPGGGRTWNMHVFEGDPVTSIRPQVRSQGSEYHNKSSLT